MYYSPLFSQAKYSGLFICQKNSLWNTPIGFFLFCLLYGCNDLVRASCTATAQATLFINKKGTFQCLLLFGLSLLRRGKSLVCVCGNYFVKASCTATAQATDAPTMGLLPNKLVWFETSHSVS